MLTPRAPMALTRSQNAGFELRVLIDQHEAHARLFGIVGGDLLLVLVGFGVEQLDEVGVGLGHVLGRHQSLVVDDRDRLEGGRVHAVLPVRPRRQRRALRRFISHRHAVGGELHLQVHRRAPHRIGRGRVGRVLADEAVVDLGRVQIGVFDLDAGKRGLEILDQRRCELGVGGRIDDDLAFLLGAVDDGIL